jgi:hypothetical protein
MMQDPNIRSNFRSSPMNSLTQPCQYFQITTLVHCSTLFKKLKVNNFHLSSEISDVQFFRRLSRLPVTL